jgi:hypothetical protein
MADTKSITYVYDVEGHTVELTRHHIGTAYARNGNVHNPTEYFKWEARVDGVVVTSYATQRAQAYEYAKASITGTDYRQPDQYGRHGRNERQYRLVAAEMKANYVKRVVNPANA